MATKTLPRKRGNDLADGDDAALLQARATLAAEQSKLEQLRQRRDELEEEIRDLESRPRRQPTPDEMLAAALPAAATRTAADARQHLRLIVGEVGRQEQRVLAAELVIKRHQAAAVEPERAELVRAAHDHLVTLQEIIREMQAMSDQHVAYGPSGATIRCVQPLTFPRVPEFAKRLLSISAVEFLRVNNCE
ncbi:MAG: hypothetical protein ACOY3P_24500 [Planctomycetota bacterium]